MKKKRLIIIFICIIFIIVLCLLFVLNFSNSNNVPDENMDKEFNQETSTDIDKNSSDIKVNSISKKDEYEINKDIGADDKGHKQSIQSKVENKESTITEKDKQDATANEIIKEYKQGENLNVEHRDKGNIDYGSDKIIATVE